MKRQNMEIPVNEGEKKKKDPKFGKLHQSFFLCEKFKIA